jgi:hypothetical protein
MEFNYKQFLTENKLTNQSKVKSLFENKINENSSVIVNGKPVDINSIEIDDVNMDDYPDFSDAYVIRATFEDGTDLTDTELEELQDEYSDLVHELAHESIQEGKEEDDDEVQDEPSSKDIKPSKSTDALAKKQYQLATLLKRKDELVSKFKSNEITIDQYKQMIGNIPQHIKTLTADIEKLELQSVGNMDESKDKEYMHEASYEVLERIDGLINRRDLELFKNALENITNDLEQEGFELPDIKAYIQRELDEVLGVYK